MANKLSKAGIRFSFFTNERRYQCDPLGATNSSVIILFCLIAMLFLVVLHSEYKTDTSLATITTNAVFVYDNAPILH